MPLCSCSALPSSISISKFINDHNSLSLLHKQCNTMREFKQLHSQLITSGLAKDPIAFSRAIEFCANSSHGDLNYAMMLFNHYDHQHHNAFMYNTLIRALSRSSIPQFAVSLFIQMLHSSEEPQRLTFPSVFVAYSQLGLACHGAQLHGMVLKLGYSNDAYIRNAMLHMYVNSGQITEALTLFDECSSFDVVSWNSMIMGLAKCGLVDKSRGLFDEIPSRNVVTWSCMIGGYARNGMNKEAMDLFYQMQEERIEPNANILVSLLGVCACLGALKQGEWIHCYIKNNKFELNPIITTAIIDMYCKCGSIDKALEVFNTTSAKVLASWNSMMSGLAFHGHCDEAINMFSQLVKVSGFQPDNVTFLSILTSCNHAGLIDKAWHYFSVMSTEYDIQPGIEHYSCMVDMLGRAGFVEEAEHLILRMPFKPDEIILGSLLSACRTYGNAEIAKRTGRQMIELHYRDTGGHVLLSNTLAKNGDFSGALRAKGMMKDKGLRKEPGCSMIEVNDEVHEFVADGVAHPMINEIHKMLCYLNTELRIACCS